MALTQNSDLSNLLTKFETLKAEVASLDERINEYKVLELEDEMGELRISVKKAYDDMKRIDSKKVFESDDEVGQTFKQLLDILENLESGSTKRAIAHIICELLLLFLLLSSL